MGMHCLLICVVEHLFVERVLNLAPLCTVMTLRPGGVFEPMNASNRARKPAVPKTSARSRCVALVHLHASMPDVQGANANTFALRRLCARACKVVRVCVHTCV